jgi:two-component system sensor histidine kinase ChvG
LRSAVETFERTTDPSKQRRLAEIISDDVKRLDRLITEISDASRLDAELSRAEVEQISLPRLLTELINFYQDRAEPGAVQVILRQPENDRLELSGIASRLGQVFQNLIDNALSFSPPGGTVLVTCLHDGRQAVVTVEDDGPGIPEENLETIFERFYTARPSTEAFGTHSGLGLNIAKQIVEAHGGTITAQNRNPGARFVVRLPV